MVNQWHSSSETAHGLSKSLVCVSSVSSTQHHSNILSDALKAPGTYNWTVGVPANVVSGQYQLALSQTGAPEAYSPFFNLEVSADYTPIVNPTIVAPFRAAPPPATVTVIYLPYPVNATTVNYIYYDEGCGCHQTSSCPVEAMPTSTYMTLATYYEHECGCTTTVEAPCAETVMPVPPAPVAATNTPMAPTVAPAAPASPATAAPMPAFTGAGSRIVGSGAGLAALAAALVLA